MMRAAAKLLRPKWNPLRIAVRNHPYPTPFIHLLQNKPETKTTTLENGLIVATEERECYNACVGFFMDAGSRYEANFQNGITHFFEHIAFKGTHARNKTALEEQITCTGAQIKCFTQRELVAYYAECLCQDVPLLVDLLSDCVFNNTFECIEIENQKRTVYCEMMEHDKDVNAVLYDYLHATAFQGTPLGQTVMGPTANLHGFNDATIHQYLKKCFDPKRMVFACCGGIKHEHMVQLAYTYLSKLEPSKCIDSDIYRYTGSEIIFRDDSQPVANVAIAVEGPCFCDDDNIVMEVAKNLYGGWDRTQPRGMDHSSNMARAASVGRLCDAYKAFNINYKDTGLWGIQFKGPSLLLEDMLATVQDEWMKLCTMVTLGEIERARRTTKTALLTKTDSCAGTCHEIGKWMLYHGYRPPLHERICAIDHVNVFDVREICSQYIYNRCPVVSAVGPTEGLPEYNRIRAGMYWLRL